MTLQEIKKEQNTLKEQSLAKVEKALTDKLKEKENTDHYLHLLKFYAELYHQIKTFK